MKHTQACTRGWGLLIEKQGWGTLYNRLPYCKQWLSRCNQIDLFQTNPILLVKLVTTAFLRNLCVALGKGHSWFEKIK
jgi:5-methylcytosine-specific restriction endonuclease McrBC regulatory subunit McrC